MKTPSRAELDKLSFDELNELAGELAEEDEEIKKVRHYFIDEFRQRVPTKAIACADLGEGEFVGASLDGRQILLAKVEGEIFALSNKCPHRGFPLHQNGKLDGYTITCSYHGGQFDIRTGACIKHPTETYPCERFQPNATADGTIVREAIKKEI